MEEVQPWGKTIYSVNSGSHTHFQTAKQTVDLITNPYFGRMLFLDGCLQSTTADEQIYHSALVQKGMGNRPQKRVLIAGGAEGATLRDVQNHDAKNQLGVEEIVMVDWDEQLVKHMDADEPWSQGSFDDPRLQLVFEDIFTFLGKKQEKPFDTILLDLLDIEESNDYLWICSVLKKCVPLLETKGGLAMNVGRSYTDAVNLRIFLQDTFATPIQCKVSEIFVPSFQEPWYLLSLVHET